MSIQFNIIIYADLYVISGSWYVLCSVLNAKCPEPLMLIQFPHARFYLNKHPVHEVLVFGFDIQGCQNWFGNDIQLRFSMVLHNRLCNSQLI